MVRTRRTFVRRSEDRRRPDNAQRQKRPRKVPTTGLEPVRRFRHWSLKPACLPIPARGPEPAQNPDELSQPSSLHAVMLGEGLEPSRG